MTSDSFFAFHFLGYLVKQPGHKTSAGSLQVRPDQKVLIDSEELLSKNDLEEDSTQSEDDFWKVLCKFFFFVGASNNVIFDTLQVCSKLCTIYVRIWFELCSNLVRIMFEFGSNYV
jgi:hypothetical protein